MKTSLAWLDSYLDRPCDADEAERVLTRVGFPIDGREEVTLASGGRDVMLDVEVTSNRSDCLSHVGLARELAAASGRTLQLPEMALPSAVGEPVGQLTSVVNDERDLCPLYTARVIRGVKVGPSPAWLVNRLAAVGLRSVNNIVDVTNFVLLELGQPLHAFDLSLLHGQRIVVRRARQGERFTAIDSTKHTLDSQMLVIADADRPVAVAGVMGGLDSEVGPATQDVLIESAMFEPLSVRRTSRVLKLASDSSYRFERGVDPRGVEQASRRAAQLILELAGGTLAEGVIRVGQAEPEPTEVAMRVARCNALLGVELSGEEQAALLAKLGLEPSVAGERVVCRVPTYRLDLRREVDLIEEVGRLYGLDRIAIRPRIEIEARSMQDVVAARQVLGRVLVAHGYHETVTFSFVSPRQGEAFVGEGDEAVLIEDERRKAEPMLRPSLLPSLLACRKTNQDLGNAGVRLFETAATWVRRAGRIVETRRLALLRDAEDAATAVRELRGAIEELVERLGGSAAAGALAFEPTQRANFTAAADIRLNGELVGVMGVVSPTALEAFDVKTAAVAAELAVDPLLGLYPPRRAVGELPRFPAIERDLSVVVDEQVAWRQIESAAREAKPAMLEAVEFLGAYRGKPIEAGRKSVSFRMVFRDPAKTLRHDEVDPQVASVVASLKQAAGAELRG